MHWKQSILARSGQQRTKLPGNFFPALGSVYAGDAMTLMDAPVYDPAPARRRKIKVCIGVVLLLVTGFLFWLYRFWPEEQVANKFFAALEQKNFEAAYGIWMQDPQWQQHPEKYKKYSFGDFNADWGLGGEWGLVKTHKIRASGECRGGGTGIVVEVTVNDRFEPAR